MRDEPPNFPDQETLEKELSDYLSKKYGYRIKVISPMMAAEHSGEPVESEKKTGGTENIRFDMKPEELESYLNQYVIRQDEPKAILATKICTPDLSLTATGMQVLFNNTGANPASLIPAGEGIATPDGSLALTFNGLGSANIEAISGSAMLEIGPASVSDLITLNGSFEFANFTPTGGTPEILASADITSATLGTASTYLRIDNATLVCLLVPGTTTGSTAYALSASGGSDSLVGFPNTITIGTTGLTVQANTGVSAGMISSAAAALPAVQTPAGASVSLSNLPSANVIQMAGTISLNIASFVSFNGSFSFIEQPGSGNTTDFLIGASNVNAFLGTSDGTVGVEVEGAQLGLVIFSSATSTSYALTASGQISLKGVPALNLSGAASVEINNTGGIVNQPISTPGGTVVNVSFADGTAIQSVSGSINLAIEPSGTPLFSLAGTFTFTMATPQGGTPELEMAATGVSASGLTPGGYTGSVSVSNGTLGLVVDPGVGYALYASATVSGGSLGGILSASGTVTLEYNTITSAENVPVNGGTMPVPAASSSTSPYQNISITNVTATSSNALIQAVIDAVEAANGGTPSPLTLGSYSLGSGSAGYFLDLTALTVTFASVSGGFSGTISATSAALFPGTSFSATLTGISGTITVSMASGVSVTAVSVSAQSMSLAMGQALLITASGTAGTPAITLSYNPGLSSQTLATVSNATATSPDFPGIPSATVTNLTIMTNGFSFSGFNLTFAGTQSDPALSLADNAISVTAATLAVSNFSVTYGSSPSLTGTIMVTLTNAALFPNGGFVTMQANTATGSFSFANFDGALPSGQLSFTISGFQLNIGQAFKLTATSVTISPDQTVIATITSATISSPDFPSLSALISNLQITQTGFTLGTLALTAQQPPTALGEILSFSSLSITFTNVAFTYSTTSSPTISGTVGVTADNVYLFPGVSFLDVSLGNLSGSYTFDAPGVLTFNNVNLTIPIGEAMTISLTGVSFTPDQPVMASGNATITSSLFPGLTATVQGFELMSTGFTLNQVILSANNVTIGSFLSFSSVKLEADDFVVNTSSSPVVSGTISATLDGIQLFPNDPSLQLQGTVTASFDLGSASALGNLTITITGFDLTIANEISLTASDGQHYSRPDDTGDCFFSEPGNSSFGQPDGQHHRFDHHPDRVLHWQRVVFGWNIQHRWNSDPDRSEPRGNQLCL